ncbi:MAG: tRNA (guanine(46)-N(7))-methyltransferase TrmB [Rhodospirillales bacterium]
MSDGGGNAVSAPPPPILYGRRHGRRLRPHRNRLMETALPGLTLRLPSDADALDPRQLFPQPLREIWLEIGFGAGEHLLAQARSHSDVGCIGCEAYINGIAALVAAWHAEPVPNIRILADDARPLLSILAPASLERVFLLFPDPWPKLRHAGRRFISHHTVGDLARAIAPGGELRIATDAPHYARWALTHLHQSEAFCWSARRPDDWRSPPPDWIPTRYQRRAEAAARTPVYLSFSRREPGPSAPRR